MFVVKSGMNSGIFVVFFVIEHFGKRFEHNRRFYYMKSIFEQSGGTYTMQGDYRLPNLTLPAEEERPIGVWGQRRLRYLKQYHRTARKGQQAQSRSRACKVAGGIWSPWGGGRFKQRYAVRRLSSRMVGNRQRAAGCCDLLFLYGNDKKSYRPIFPQKEADAPWAWSKAFADVLLRAT